MKVIIFLFSFFLVLNSFSQPGTPDMSFNPDDVGYGNGDGSNSSIHCVTVQADGKILIGGFFIRYNGSLANRIARLNPDGSFDDSFNTGTGFSGEVWSIKVQPDGKILVGGTFTTYNDTSVNRITRLNPNGSIDTSFNAGTSIWGVFDYGVYAIAIDSENKILIGGTFARRLARLNPDGSVDDDFAVGSGFNSEVNTNNSIIVRSVLVQTDGKILAGGNFTKYIDSPVYGIVRLNPNGVIDHDFNTGTGFKRINNADGSAHSLALQADGKIVAGGSFIEYNGRIANYIARINTDGSMDTTFNTGSGINIGSDIRHILLQPDNRIVVGGNFTSYNETLLNNLVRLNVDGTIDNDFNTEIGTGGYIQSLALQSGGELVAVGNLGLSDGTKVEGMMRILPDGSMDNAFNTGTGINGSFSLNTEIVSALALSQDGKILVGGNFYRYNTSQVRNLLLLNPHGSLNTDFKLGKGFNSPVYSLAVQSDGRFLAGGNFVSYNDTVANYLARLNPDGSLDNEFQIGTGFNNPVRAISVQPDGKIIAGGNFTSYNDTAVNRIIRLNPDGTIDKDFIITQGFPSLVRTIALQSNGKILVGGLFTSYDDTPANRLARLNADGTLDTEFNVGSGFNNAPLSIVIQQDSLIIVGGAFTSYNGTPTSRIVRINPDGSLDNTFITGTGFNNIVRSVALQSNGKILAAGEFTGYSGSVVNRLALINPNGSIDHDFTLGEGFNGTVYSVILQPDGNILAGGNFTAYHGTGRNRIARINGDPVLVSSGNYSGIESGFMVYPNPVKDVFSIDSRGEEIVSITLFDLQGRPILKNSPGTTILNTEGLPEGFYLVKVETKNRTEVLKIFKK